MPNPAIQFGTDGWRSVIADGFTFESVREVTQAIGVTAGELEPPEGIDRGKLIVGYDRRFLSREFAQEVALELSKSGIDVLLSDAPVPSQAVSFTAVHRRVLGGVVVTASHNPSSYNGLKFKGWYGGSALPEMYARISANLGKHVRRGGGSVTEVDLLTDYIAAVRDFLDVEKLRDADLKILHDPIHGVAAGLPARIVGVADKDQRKRIGPAADSRPRKSPVIKTVRGEMNPSFGGVNPEPIPENLDLSRRLMAKGGYDLAICNDGDADRLGVLDEKGSFVSPQKIIALLAIYLLRRKGWRGELVKTFSTSRLLEKLARALAVPLHETPIGFKYIADLMLSREILIGGEESGGIGFGRFLPERDGILSGLLVAECVADARKPLSGIVAEMEEEFGVLHYDRRDVHRSVAVCQRLIDRVRAGKLDSSFGLPVTSREEKDGVKLNFRDGSWLLFRKSGTEPMIRIYCESPDAGQVAAMLDTAVEELDRE